MAIGTSPLPLEKMNRAQRRAIEKQGKNVPANNGPRGECCGTCIYYLEDRETAEIDGICREGSPQITFFHDGSARSGFPITARDRWCGKHCERKV